MSICGFVRKDQRNKDHQQQQPSKRGVTAASVGRTERFSRSNPSSFFDDDDDDEVYIYFLKSPCYEWRYPFAAGHYGNYYYDDDGIYLMNLSIYCVFWPLILWGRRRHRSWSIVLLFIIRNLRIFGTIITIVHAYLSDHCCGVNITTRAGNGGVEEFWRIVRGL